MPVEQAFAADRSAKARARATPPAGGNSADDRSFRRWIGAMAAVPCWIILAVAATLEPRVGGHGTHEQLGMAGCSWISQHGRPCPACGLTTAVAAMAHGRLGLALRANAFGAAMSVALLATALAGTAQAMTGRRLVCRARPRLWWLAAGLTGLLAGWGLKWLLM